MKVGWILFVIAILTVAVLAFLFSNRFFVARGYDSASIIRSEEKSLLRDAQFAFTQQRLMSSRFPDTPSLAQPLAVSISGKNATLSVAGEMDPNHRTYADLWYDVYRKYHGDHWVVCIHVVWTNGGFYDTAPLDDIGWFVPKCPLP
jgi:hypothetical protein